MNNLSLSKSHYGLGTELYLQAYGINAEHAINESIKKLDYIDDTMSAFKSMSDVGKVNNNAGISYVPISESTYYLIKESIKYSKLLKGAFDITARPLVELWNSSCKNHTIPNKKDIKYNLKLVNFKNILFNDSSKSIKLKRKNQKIDLGGIAKGYATDEVTKIFTQHKISSGLINLGGNVYVLGNKPDGSHWKVGVQNPFDDRGSYVGILNLSNKSIVTSGNYERYYTINNKRYHHILDLKTGYPSENEIASVTIISDFSTIGDGLSTGIYLLGVEKSLKLVEGLENVDLIIITKNKEVFTTSGLSNSFNLTNTNFTINT